MRYLIIILLFTGLSLTAEAQSTRRIAFHPEMYIGLNTGLNSYWGEGFTNYLQKELLNSVGISGRVTFGSVFSPFWSVRGFMGYSSHSWPDNRNNDLVQTFSAENLTLDLMLNLSNLVQYKQDHSFTMYAFGGGGLAYPNSSAQLSNRLFYIFRGGLQGDFKLTESIDLNVIGELNVVDDPYNGYPVTGIDGTPFDLYPAITVGFTYHFRTSNNPCSFVSRKIRFRERY